jgi:uncharacterized protein with HEPN domain
MNSAGFLANELIQDAVIRNFEIIGEASHNIEAYYPAFAESHPELPLAFAYQMRNAVAHGYFKVDYEVSGQRFRPALRRFICKSKPWPNKPKRSCRAH